MVASMKVMFRSEVVYRRGLFTLNSYCHRIMLGNSAARKTTQKGTQGARGRAGLQDTYLQTYTWNTPIDCSSLIDSSKTEDHNAENVRLH